VCLEKLNIKADLPQQPMPMYELSFSAKTTGTVMLDWPEGFDVLFSAAASDIEVSDSRVWEFVDPNRPAIASTLPAAGWAKFAMQIFVRLVQGYNSANIKSVTSPAAWPRPIPGGLAQAFDAQNPNQFYMEVLGGSRVLYLPTVVNTPLLELVDGSGAPTLNSLLSNMPPPLLSVFSFACQGGRNLRQGQGAPPVGTDFLATIGLGPEHAIPSTLP
jgi:hypothetical protein